MTKYLVKNKEELQEIIKTNSLPLNTLDVSLITDMSGKFILHIILQVGILLENI